MVDEVITKQELIDAQKDAQSLDDFINGGDEQIVVTRLLKEYPTLENVIRQVYEKGGKFYPTLAAANADIANIRADVYVITGDNGAYYKATPGATDLTKSPYDPVEQAKNYADANPLFKPIRLLTGADLNTIGSGYFVITSDSVASGISNMPWSSSRQGYIYSLRDYTAHHQIAVPRNLDVNKIRQRFGNGLQQTDPAFTWGSWEDVVSMSDIDNLTTLISRKPTLNLFPNPQLTQNKASTYQATHLIEDGFDVLKMDAGGIKVVYYDIPIDSQNFRIGDTISISSEAFTDVASATVGAATSADISLLCLNEAGSNIAPSTTYSSTKANEWNKIEFSRVIPELTAKLRIRFTHRNFGNVSKFRKAVLSSSSYYAQFITENSNQSTVAATNILYVSKTGNNSNIGTQDKPLLTIQAAIDLLPNGGEIKVLDGEAYRESLILNSHGNIKISPVKDGRVNLFGSNQLVVTKTIGYTKVYQAPLASKPIGMGAPRGLPMIAEWGTPSKLIDESTRHYLHHGKTHRLPYTELYEVASKAEVESQNGVWYWENGIIYFSATDGGVATLKRYEARMRPVLTHNNGTIELIRVNSWFSNDVGMKFNGLKTKRSSCQVFGAFSNGFSDNANVTESYKDESGGNGNDGFNGSVGNYSSGYKEVNTRIEQVYFDPYGHDNGDDGLSCHYRGDATIFGGLFEYNTKADVVHVTGANCVCYNTESRGTTNGFYSATVPTGDEERVKTVFKCVSTKASENQYSYRAGDNSLLQCENTIAIDPTEFGYYQTGVGAINALDCKYSGDPSRKKSGTVNVTNTESLT